MITAILCVLLTIVLFERKKENFLLKDHFYYALIVKLGAGIAVGCLYHFYYVSGDTLSYFHDAGKALDVLVIDVETGIRFLLFGKVDTMELIYANQPRALFFVRLITPLIMITGKSYWGLTLLISLCSFIITWLLANRLASKFNVSFIVVSIALFYFPEVVFWSSGVLKESLSLLFQYALLLLVIEFITNRKIIYVFYFMLTAYLLYRLKFYVAAVYLPFLISYVVAEIVSKKKELVFMFSFLCFVFVATIINPHLSISTVLNQLFLNMERTIANSETDKFIVLPFDGSIVSFFKSIPLALSSLIRPFLWEAKGTLLFCFSLLKLDLLIGFVLALIWGMRLNYEAKLILFYSVIMIVLLAIASPNFGTLSRYSVSYLPFFMLVILTPIVSFLEKKKV